MTTQAIFHSIQARLRQGYQAISSPARKSVIQRASSSIAVSLGVTGTVMVMNSLGWLQSLEFQAFDLFSRHQLSGEQDSRIAVLEVAEADITAMGQWPMSDAQLATLLEQLNDYEPRVVGMDLYRDVAVPPGLDQLNAAYLAMPQLVGVAKAAGQRVPASSVLSDLNRIALADLVLDADRHVRRGLISMDTGLEGTGENIKFGIGAWLALSYLETEGVSPRLAEDGSKNIELGKATFSPLRDRSGGYQGVDSGGYQILMNYRGGQSGGREIFPTYSITEVLNGTLSPDLLKDRIVLVGATATSLNDAFATPYSHSLFQRRSDMPGVFIHAHLTRQILTAALEGKGLLSYWAEPWEYLWIGLWAIAALGLTRYLLKPGAMRRFAPPGGLVFSGVLLLSGGVLLSGYGLFSLGWWIPVGAPLLAIVAQSIATMAYHHQLLERLALMDELTQVANRRQFDHVLRQEIQQRHYVSLILCDIDYFKPYNDTYGHQAGDECLSQVAGMIRQAVRNSDLVARYGGEEFAVILPNTHPELAEEVGERIRASVESLQLEHSGSQIGPHVTLSCGVTTVHRAQITSAAALELADSALYAAKHQGRNCVVLRLDGDSRESAEMVGV